METKILSKNKRYLFNQQPLEQIKIDNNTEQLSLEKCFEMFSEKEELDENNEWFCDICQKKQKAIKKLEIYYAPKILIIQLKRFNNSEKIETKVNFPIKDLDLSKYVLSKDEDDDIPIKYDLFAVANHYGTISKGHCTAFCKNSLKNKWYEYNDSNVKEISEDNIITKDAYILFYKRKGISHINWKKIYDKKLITNIDINDYDSLINFDEDFMTMNCSYDACLSKDNDISDYDKEIKEKYIEKKLHQNFVNIENNINNIYSKSDDFLGKKREKPNDI